MKLDYESTLKIGIFIIAVVSHLCGYSFGLSDEYRYHIYEKEKKFIRKVKSAILNFLKRIFHRDEEKD